MPKKGKKSVIKINILNSKLTSALDRTQTSDPFASHIIKHTVEATVSALGVDKSEVSIKPSTSISTVRKKRRLNREVVVGSLMNDFASEPGPFLVHWDGKLLSDHNGKF